MVFVFHCLGYFTYHDTFQFHPHCHEDRSSIFLSAVSMPVCMHHSFFIHSSTDGHLGCFQHLAIVNNAAVNIGVHRFFWISVSGFLGYNPCSGITGSKGSSIFSFLRKFHTIFHSGCPSLHSHQQRTSRVPFFPQSRQHLLFIDLLMMAFLYVLQEEVSVQVLCLFF